MSSHSYISRLRNGDAAPEHFVRHEFVRHFHVDLPLADVWAWLNDPETFIRGQIWPWRVEFIGGGMEPGVLCNHTGPWMNFPAIIGEVREPVYRDLQYLYGAYAISHRLVRPKRLQFWTKARPSGGTDVRIALECYTHRRFARIWSGMQRLFWARFPRWMLRAVHKKQRKARNAVLARLPFVNASMPSTGRPTRSQ